MVASNLVLIPGAGGVGRAVFKQLRAQDVPVRFMVRREDERAAELKGLGAEVVLGDLTRPETVAADLATDFPGSLPTAAAVTGPRRGDKPHAAHPGRSSGRFAAR